MELYKRLRTLIEWVLILTVINALMLAYDTDVIYRLVHLF